jgi:hypothetical protein
MKNVNHDTLSENSLPTMYLKDWADSQIRGIISITFSMMRW